MSSHSSQQTEEKTVPHSVVFATVGVIILLSAVAIWIVAPASIPWALYNVATTLLPEDMAQALPTPAAVAIVPTRAVSDDGDVDVAALTLLPETPSEVDLSGDNSPQVVTDGSTRIGQPTRILIPVIELDAPVSGIGLEQLESDGEIYYQWRVPDRFEAGWHDSSARLGEVGNTVLNGHHNVFGEVFADLVELDTGDRIILFDADQEYMYEVTQREIFPERGQPLSVRLENSRWIEPTDDERVTLVTCWPKTDNSHRLVIVAQPVPAVGSATSSQTN